MHTALVTIVHHLAGIVNISRPDTPSGSSPGQPYLVIAVRQVLVKVGLTKASSMPSTHHQHQHGQHQHGGRVAQGMMLVIFIHCSSL